MPKQTEKLSDVQLRAWVKQGAPIVGKSDGAGLVCTLTKGGCAASVFQRDANGKITGFVSRRESHDLVLTRLPVG